MEMEMQKMKNQNPNPNQNQIGFLLPPKNILGPRTSRLADDRQALGGVAVQ